MLKYSIITPSYNQAEFLERTILSILNQNYGNLELIIIDGGSSDGSVDIIKKYHDKIAYWVSETDRGQSHAFNKGLEIATGDIIGWLNSDDVYYAGTIIQSAEIFESKHDADIIFANYDFIDENDNLIKHRKEILFNYNIYLWTKDCYHANCAGFYRKRCFDIAGGLSENLHYSMDYELYLRFSKHGFKFHQVHNLWGAYRMHSLSKSVASFHNMPIEAQKVFKEYENGTTHLENIFLPPFYRSYRITKKLLTGCYF
ncbi:MAG: hypothetical protein A2068_13840 [Ignavibacteria bacterium GWB2_35_6b]|nr:MAG: hypothetical protein A2068_13840 [Ignavibacteria bacterium GWB2_35_6b]